MEYESKEQTNFDNLHVTQTEIFLLGPNFSTTIFNIKNGPT